VAVRFAAEAVSMQIQSWEDKISHQPLFVVARGIGLLVGAHKHSFVR